MAFKKVSAYKSNNSELNNKFPVHVNWEIFSIKLMPGNIDMSLDPSISNSVLPSFTSGQIRLYLVTNLSTRNVPH